MNRLQLNMKEATDIVRDRQEWRHRISTSSSPLGWRASKKNNCRVATLISKQATRNISTLNIAKMLIYFFIMYYFFVFVLCIQCHSNSNIYIHAVWMTAICRANHDTHADIQLHSQYREIIVCDAYFASITLHTETHPGVKVSRNAREHRSMARKFKLGAFRLQNYFISQPEAGTYVPGPSKLATFAIVIQQLISHSNFTFFTIINSHCWMFFTKLQKNNMKSCLIHSVNHW